MIGVPRARRLQHAVRGITNHSLLSPLSSLLSRTLTLVAFFTRLISVRASLAQPSSLDWLRQVQRDCKEDVREPVTARVAALLIK